MNRVSRSMLAGAALALALAGCEQTDTLPIAANGAPPQPVAKGTPIAQMPKGDPSVPDVATTFAAQDVAETTQATQDTATLQRKATPQEEMTRAEESKAMPLPSQANDHSTTALDRNKGG